LLIAGGRRKRKGKTGREKEKKGWNLIVKCDECWFSRRGGGMGSKRLQKGGSRWHLPGKRKSGEKGILFHSSSISEGVFS